MPFEAHPSPKVAENGEKLLYVKPQSGLVRTLSEFEMWFHDKFSLRQGDMNRVFEAMLDGAPEWFAAGYRIETPIGTFSPKLKLKRQVTDPDDISHDDVELDGIEFQPSKSFIKNMEYAVVRDGFRYVRKPATFGESPTAVHQGTWLCHRCEFRCPQWSDGSFSPQAARQVVLWRQPQAAVLPLRQNTHIHRDLRISSTNHFPYFATSFGFRHLIVCL